MGKTFLPLSQGISYCVISIVICHKLRGGEGVQINPYWDHPPKSSSSDKQLAFSINIVLSLVREKAVLIFKM